MGDVPTSFLFPSEYSALFEGICTRLHCVLWQCYSLENNAKSGIFRTSQPYPYIYLTKCWFHSSNITECSRIPSKRYTWEVLANTVVAGRKRKLCRTLLPALDACLTLGGMCYTEDRVSKRVDHELKCHGFGGYAVRYPLPSFGATAATRVYFPRSRCGIANVLTSK